MDRREFINSMGLLVGSTMSVGMYTWQIEPFWLEVVRLPMTFAQLPEQLQGKTVMQISDIHVGDRFDWRFIVESFQKVKELEPDFVVYTGDYVSYKDETQITQLRTVMQHAVKGKIATLGILGNHDYGKNWRERDVADRITAVMKEAGVDILRNEAKTVNGLHIIGVDDFWGPAFDWYTVKQNYDMSKPNIVLCHNPDVCDLDVWGEYTGWILSGHTHGGQCKPPFLPPPILPVKNKQFTSGHIRLDEKRNLYINRALGHLWQVRFNMRPEITLFTLSGSEVAHNTGRNATFQSVLPSFY